MKQSLVLVLLLAVAASAVAVEDAEVAYVGGTAPNVKPGTIGRLDTAQPTSLVFQYSGGKFDIPYAAIESFEYSKERAHDLAVLPIVAVGMFKRLQRQHFVRITYRDEANFARAVVFELSKHMPRAVLAVLEARAPQGCKASEINRCERAAERVLPNPWLAQR